jgi:hypothetical protein
MMLRAVERFALHGRAADGLRFGGIHLIFAVWQGM